MGTKESILKMLTKRGHLSTEEIERAISISRQAIHLHLKELLKEERIIKVGRTRGAYYVLNEKSALTKAFGKEFKKEDTLSNIDLHEDQVFHDIEETSIFHAIKPNVKTILAYAFTEILNNAIEHSGSKTIHYQIIRNGRTIEFTIKDHGSGVFKNIRSKFNLASDLEAIQELIKGKSTTAPEKHTGEGIFFTAKAADKFSLSSFDKSLTFDNGVDDVFVKEEKSSFQGTTVKFTIGLESAKILENIFKEYSNESFVFDKSKVNIKLFAGETEYMSRSQAKRLLNNLDKFAKIILDFKDIKTIGQGFADQIFRIFRLEHPEIEIETINCSDMVLMMIKHVKG